MCNHKPLLSAYHFYRLSYWKDQIQACYRFQKVAYNLAGNQNFYWIHLDHFLQHLHYQKTLQNFPTPCFDIHHFQYYFHQKV